MGQKTHPIGFRLGISQNWQTRWFASSNGEYARLVAQDIKIRDLIRNTRKDGGISSIEIDRDTKEIVVTIKTSRLGVIVGRSGKRIDDLRDALVALTGEKVRTNVVEVRFPELDATQMAQSIASQIEARISYRRALRNAIQRTMQSGARGIKITVSGRLGGAEIARSDTQLEGSVPLHTLSAKIDYAVVEAHTTYGVIGVKVWIYTDEQSEIQAENMNGRDKRDRRRRDNRNENEEGGKADKRERGAKANAHKG